MQTIEQSILANLMGNERYMRKVIPFIKMEYFSDRTAQIIFSHVKTFIDKYNTLPTKDALLISFNNDKSIGEDDFSSVVNNVNAFEVTQGDVTWLVDETEKYCKDRAVYNAILSSISIIDGRDKKQSQDAIPHLLEEALSVGFDTSVGHDYIDDASDRYSFYHKVEERIPFDIDLLNKITGGGLPKKTLNIILGGTGGGKSLFMCHMAAASLSQGKNVLYITLEMAEERIAERIDANLMNTPLDELKDVPRETFENRVKKISNKTQGKLIIKEYPTTTAHAGHFKSLLNELRLKRNFNPDIIFVDYLNICASTRYKPGANANSYTVVKSIAEELRGLAVEQNVPLVSATQTTRTGYGNTDLELTDTSESFGLPATADFMIGIISTEDLDKLNQLMVKQLKNRYNDPTMYKRFVIGVDRSKMRLYNLENAAQKLVDSGKPSYENDLSEGYDYDDLPSRNKKWGNLSSIKV